MRRSAQCLASRQSASKCTIYQHRRARQSQHRNSNNNNTTEGKFCGEAIFSVRSTYFFAFDMANSRTKADARHTGLMCCTYSERVSVRVSISRLSFALVLVAGSEIVKDVSHVSRLSSSGQLVAFSSRILHAARRRNRDRILMWV
jgi:hypothetical protein